MSNKDDDFIDKILVSVLVGIVGTLVGMFVTREKDPEEKLRSEMNSGDWQTDIEAITCPHCETVNASDEPDCFNCGQSLPPPQRQPAESSEDWDELVAFLEKNWVLLLLVAVVAILIIAF